MRAKISKLKTKVKGKIAMINNLKKKDKIEQLKNRGSTDAEIEKMQIDDEVTFEHFTSGTFPWESNSDSTI